MTDFVKVWWDTLPSTVKVILAIVLSAIMLGAGVYDNRTQVQQNRADIEAVQDSLSQLREGLVSLGRDTGDILCILIQAGEEDPLVCIEDRRFNDIMRR